MKSFKHRLKLQTIVFGILLLFTFNANAQFGNAIRLDGSSYVQSSSTNSALGYTPQEFTIEVWFKNENTATSGISTVAQRENGSEGWQLYLSHNSNGTSSVNFKMVTNDINKPNLSVNSNSIDIPKNTWTHVGIVFDGHTGHESLKMFINGESVSTDNLYDYSGHNMQTSFSEYLKIGADKDENNKFVGQIDQFRMYSMQKSNFNDRFTTSSGSPVLHYNFDETSSNLVNEGGTGLTGTIVGTVRREPCPLTAAPLLSNFAFTPTEQGASFSFYSNNTGTAYFEAVPSSSSAPTSVSSNSISLAVNNSLSHSISGLAPGTSYDLYYQSNDGTNTSAVLRAGTFNTNPAPQNAINFNGSNYAEVNSPSGLPTGGDSRTVEFWMKGNLSSNTGGNRTVLSYGKSSSTDGSCFGLSIDTNGYPYFDAEGASYISKHNENILDDKWHHIGLCYNGYAVDFYIDDIKVNTKVLSLNTVNDLLRLGMRTTGVTNDFNGSLDNVRIWDKALSGEEIRTVATQDYTDIASSLQSNIVLSYNFNQSSGNVFNEVNLATNMATLQGSPSPTFTSASASSTVLPPYFANGFPNVSAESFTSATINLNLNKTCEVYYLVDETATHTVTEVLAGTKVDYTTTNTDQTINLSGLIPNKTYYVHLIAKTASGEQQPAVTTLNFTTLNRTAQKFYVKQTEGNDSNDGASWANAFQTLQAALDVAKVAGDEIWVAKGSYQPTKDPFGNTSPTDPRDKTFMLFDGIKIYGGFSGTESTISERKISTYLTILDGDIGTSGVDTDNAYHVIVSVDDTNQITLDGFTIKNGNANGTTGNIIVETKQVNRAIGGGICSTGSDLKILNCIISNNNSSSFGGGANISTSNSGTDFTQCVFTNNTASVGSAISFPNSKATIANTIFYKNNISSTVYKGAIRYNGNSTNIQIINSIFNANAAVGSNGNADIYEQGTGATLTITNTITQEEGTDGTNGNKVGVDPKFKDAPNGDFTLLPGSPAINAGTETGITLPATDLAGNTRTQGSAVDMGVIEADGVTPAFDNLTVTASSETAASFDISINNTGEIDNVYYVVKLKTEGIPDANEVLASTNKFQYDTNTSPNNQSITGLSAFTDYRLSVVLKDSYGNQTTVLSKEFKTLDTTAPTAVTDFPNITEITETSAKFNIKTSEKATIHYLVKESSQTAPDKPSVEAATTFVSYDGVNTTATTVGLNDLQLGTKYKIYYVMKDESNNTSNVASLAFNTIDETAPTAATDFPTVTEITETSANFNIKTSEKATIHYLVKESSQTAPDKTTVESATTFVSYDGVNTTASAVGLTDLLAKTSYKIYYVMKDDSSNVSEVASYDFNTVDLTAPSIITGFPTLEVFSSLAKFVIKTDDSGTLKYKVSEGTASVSLADLTSEAVIEANTETEITLDNLNEKTSYQIHYTVVDAANNNSTIATKSFTTFEKIEATFSKLVSFKKDDKTVVFEWTNPIEELDKIQYILLNKAGDTIQIITPDGPGFKQQIEVEVGGDVHQEFKLITQVKDSKEIVSDALAFASTKEESPVSSVSFNEASTAYPVIPVQPNTYLEQLKSFTIEMKVKLVDVNKKNILMIYGINGGTSFSPLHGMYVENGEIFFEITLADGTKSKLNTEAKVLAVQGTQTINPETWYNISGTFDHIGKEMSIYVDGELQKKQAVASDLLKQPNKKSGESASLVIASDQVNADNLIGNVHDLRIWSLPKTVFTDISTDLKGNESNLEAYYLLAKSSVVEESGKSSTLVVDLSGNENNMEISDKVSVENPQAEPVFTSHNFAGKAKTVELFESTKKNPIYAFKVETAQTIAVNNISLPLSGSITDLENIQLVTMTADEIKNGISPKNKEVLTTGSISENKVTFSLKDVSVDAKEGETTIQYFWVLADLKPNTSNEPRTFNVGESTTVGYGTDQTATLTNTSYPSFIVNLLPDMTTADVEGVETSSLNPTSFKVTWKRKAGALNYQLEVATATAESVISNTFPTKLLDGYPKTINDTTAFVGNLTYASAYVYRVIGISKKNIKTDGKSLKFVTTPTGEGTKSDSIALKTILKSVTKNKETLNWETENLKLRDWNRVKLNADKSRIIAVDLSDLGIKGTMNLQEIVSSLSTDQKALMLSELDSMNLSKNELSEIVLHKNINSLDISENTFDFDKIKKINASVDKKLYYNNQKTNVYFDNLQIQENDTLPFNATIGSTLTVKLKNNHIETNTYQWLLDGKAIEIDNTVYSSSENTLTIKQPSATTQGKYSAKISNTAFKDLTLDVVPQQIYSQASVTIKTLGKDGNILPKINAYFIKINDGKEAFDTLFVKKGIQGRIKLDNIRMGKYILSAEADEYTPTYYGDNFSWEEADTLIITGNTEAIINMIAIPKERTTADGSGAVDGVIWEDDSLPLNAAGRTLAKRRAKKRKCGLRKRRTGGGRAAAGKEWELFAYGETNDNGEFEFGFLPQGTYRFFVEFPGIPMDEKSETEFTIGEAGVSQEKFKLEANITEDGVSVEAVVDKALGVKKSIVFNIYPNPATQFLQIDAQGYHDAFRYEMIDMTGQIIKSFSSNSVDVYSLKDGIYLLRIIDKENKVVKTERILIKH